FAKQFENYEARPQQMEMMRAVVKAFNENGVAFVEAATGVGKSLAYLIPSMMWAIQNGERVVISTNTINLQEQLADKDVPSVIKILGQEARAAVMKGKGRYLCPLRLKRPAHRRAKDAGRGAGAEQNSDLAAQHADRRR
ncbi:MAG: DEAD/DEAH box helicase, partial [Anaerolineae bacterium]|nr:DEAD/DEAH box helicase [Anaerolineae bacterium]